MRKNSKERALTFNVLKGEDAAASADLVARVFSQDEPLAVGSGQSRDELFAMMSAATPSALNEALSIGAWNRGALVGAVIATDFTWLPPDGTEALSPNFAPIGALLAELEADFEARPPSELQSCVHIHMLAVERPFRDAQIAGTLVQRCIEIAARKGFLEIVADATNPASQRVFARAGFAPINSVHYDSFTFEGERVFVSIENASETVLMMRAL